VRSFYFIFDFDCVCRECCISLSIFVAVVVVFHCENASSVHKHSSWSCACEGEPQFILKTRQNCPTNLTSRLSLFTEITPTQSTDVLGRTVLGIVRTLPVMLPLCPSLRTMLTRALPPFSKYFFKYKRLRVYTALVRFGTNVVARESI
jgi:hypothetical protein